MAEHIPAKLSDLCELDAHTFAAAAVYRGEELSGPPARTLVVLSQREPEQNGAVQVAAGVVEESGGREEREGVEVGQEEGEGLSRWTCKSCASVFLSLEQQRSHFKSDFHRLNIKRKIHGKVAFTEEEFEVFARGQIQHENDDVSSISGSEDENSDDESDGDGKPQFRLTRSVHIPFLLHNLGQLLSVWRPVLVADKEFLQGERGYADSSASSDALFVNDEELLRRLKLLKKSDANSVWVVLLSTGGHFAAVVASIAGGAILAHQTFHRYVVRAKAGGRQSTKDATGKAPKSAGASLRRYNEKALQKDIRDLLVTWKDYLRQASHIFVHAPSANSPSLFGGDDAPLSRNDARVRNIPFTTRRPTFREAKRVFGLLTSLAYREPVSMDKELNMTRMEASIKKKSAKGVSLVDGQAHQKSSSQGGTQDVEALHSTPNASDAQKQSGLTPLHEASKVGNTELVLELLKAGADPCVKEVRGRTPYALAADKDTRNVFRRFMADNSDMWDWNAANVPGPLTAEMEAAQATKLAEKDAKRKAKMKELKKQKKAQEKAQQAEAKAAELAAAAVAKVRYGEASQSKKLSKAGVTASQNPQAFEQALLKAQVQERDMRAAAAELRLRALALNATGGSASSQPQSAVTDPCSCCGTSLSGKVPFTRYSYRYCSSTCTQVHRIMLEGE